MESRKRRISEIGRQNGLNADKQVITKNELELLKKRCVKNLKVNRNTNCSSLSVLSSIKDSYGTGVLGLHTDTKVTCDECLFPTKADKAILYNCGRCNEQKSICTDTRSGENPKLFNRDDSGYQSDECLDSPLPDHHQEAETPYGSLDCNVEDGGFTKKTINGSQKPRPYLVINPTKVVKDSTDDLMQDNDESDVITVNDTRCLMRNTQPDCIDGSCSWATDSWNSPVEEKLIKYGTLDVPRPYSLIPWISNEKHDSNSKILIPHPNADSLDGDSFGARIVTYNITPKDGHPYYQHFFEEVNAKGPAVKMKIQEWDELVFLNSAFTPSLNNADVLNLFHHVKVDGKSRLDLIIRRIIINKRDGEKKSTNRLGAKKLNDIYEWIETSAVLAPVEIHFADLNSDRIKVENEKCHTVNQDGFEPFVCRYKVQGSQLFLDIRETGVEFHVITDTDADKTMCITTNVRVHANTDPGDPHVSFEAALSDVTRTRFIGMNDDNNIVLMNTPFWFEMVGVSEVSFSRNNRYFACNRVTGSAETKTCKYTFIKIIPKCHDHPDNTCCGTRWSCDTTQWSCDNTERSPSSYSHYKVGSGLFAPSGSRVKQQDYEDNIRKNNHDQRSECQRNVLSLSIPQTFPKTDIVSDAIKTPTTPFAAMCFSG